MTVNAVEAFGKKPYQFYKPINMTNKKGLIKRGSATAKGGFKNEKDVIDKFNDWQKRRSRAKVA